jgi:hypothetical protein
MHPPPHCFNRTGRGIVEAEGRMTKEDETKVLTCCRDHGALEPWPFELPKNAAIFTVRHVLEENRPLVYVAHTESGWDALPDGGPFDPIDDGCFICLACLVERNPSLVEVASLPLGWEAVRAPNGSWESIPRAPSR